MPTRACTTLRCAFCCALDKIRRRVCNRLHAFKFGMHETRHLPRHTISAFIATHTSKSFEKAITQWYARWNPRAYCRRPAQAAKRPRGIAGIRHTTLVRMRNAPGKGRPYKQSLVRHAVHICFGGIPFAIDWTALSLRNNFCSDAQWFALFESECCVSFTHANRLYEVVRHVRHLRQVLFWISMFRVRKYILLAQGYEPVLWNFDETPYYQNAAGAHDKPTLTVQGACVSIVENMDKTHSRWTANLSCCSSPERIMQRRPWAEAMFKAVDNGPKYKELQELHRTRGYPRNLSVTTAPKATYRESDIIAMLQHHHPDPTPDQPWEIEISDDFSAHRTPLVKDVQWSRKKFGMTFGGGVTGAQQPCDGALNQHVRRQYGMLEANKLLRQMQQGVSLPTTTEADSLFILSHIWNTSEHVHMRAAQGTIRPVCRSL